VGETLARSARKYPEREAVVYPRKDVRFSYREFDNRAIRWANALESLGVTPGERVALLLHNSAELVMAVYGTARAGATITPVNYRLAPGEVRYILEDCDASVLLFEEATRDTVERAREELDCVDTFVDIDDDRRTPPSYAVGFNGLLDEAASTPPEASPDPSDRYAIMYTSGTTGRPKGVVHTHENATYHNLLYVSRMGYDLQDVGVSAMPLYHNAELNTGFFPRVNVGATSVVLHSFESDTVLDVIEREGVTHLFVASRTWSTMLDAASERELSDSSLQLGLYGAAPMPPSLLEDCMEVFTENWATAYGMTEMGPAATFLLPFETRDKLESVGRPGPNHDLRIVAPTAEEDLDDPVTPADTRPTGQVGEIILRGPPIMEEYWHLPEKTATTIRDGWFFTGDAGYVDEDGYLYLVDRIDDMIISGGENIYPTEVENALYKHTGVQEAAVVGEPDDEWGERVVAYVIAEEGVTAEALDGFLRSGDEFADFKRPREYVFRDDLPRNPSGKLQKFKLRDSTDA
jgi:fatty-acyl-CoA synthase